MIFAGDFNINVLDFKQNKKVQNFVNLMFQFGLEPTVNKPTRVTSIYNNDFKTGIIKRDISDHFPIIYAFKLRTSMSSSIFLPKFRKPSHSYPTPFPHLNNVKPIPKLNKAKYGISYRGPFIWNNFLSTTDKEITDVAKFKAATKSKLLSLRNETRFYQYQIFVLLYKYILHAN